MNAPDWRIDAACLGIGGEIFFPLEGLSTAPAKRVCAGCPVRAECLEFALDRRIKFGIFGGLTEGERRVVLRRRAQSERGAA